MESELLLKEDEFRKENEKLELKTKQLMHKVNDVMKIQDNLIKDTFRTQAELRDVQKNNYKFTKNLPIDDDVVKLEETTTSEDGTGNNNSGVLRIYKAKLKSLAAEKERVQVELRQKAEETKKLQKENQLLKEEKEKWFFLYNSGKNNIGKLESQVAITAVKLQSKDSENACIKKEVEHLKKELKTASLNLNNSEVRLARACEEVEKLKTLLKQSKDESKELRDGYRKQLNELTSAVKRLEKQKLDLLNGFKKQMQLIDVLKKQKIYLEASKISEAMEAEYLRILDWKFD